VPFFIVDAFASKRFTGNPAAVVVFEQLPNDEACQAIAAENNQSETAFLEPAGDGFNLRWFTPKVEVPLCGHATLASAWVVFERLQRARTEITFKTRKAGSLHVIRSGEGFKMDFPERAAVRVTAAPGLSAALGTTPVEVLANETNYLAVLADAATVRNLGPDLAAIRGLDRDGLIVTAPGDQGYDFVSRYFTPQRGIDEDPVTGGAHCALAPYWSARLRKTDLRAYQASRRGGEVACRMLGDRVELEGRCILHAEGFMEHP
jgi:PhzF family phenazine biosynthesis protein